jgi:hypothetical protein
LIGEIGDREHGIGALENLDGVYAAEP